MLAFIAERQKQSVMSRYGFGMSAAVCFANQKSQQKYHKELVMKDSPVTKPDAYLN